MSAPGPPPTTSRRTARGLGTAAVLLASILFAVLPRPPSARGQQQPATVEVAGQLGGVSAALAVVAPDALRVGAGPRVLGLRVESRGSHDGPLVLTRTWRSPALAGVVRDVAPAGERTVAVGNRFGVALLDAMGQAWSEVARGFDARRVHVDAAGRTAVVAGRDGTLYSTPLQPDEEGLLQPVPHAPLLDPERVEDVTAAALVGDTWWVALSAREELPVAWLVPVDVGRPELPAVGRAVALDAVVLDLAGTADGRLLALEERVGLVLWEVSDEAAPTRLGELSLQELGAPAWSVAADPNAADVAWILGSAANALDPNGLVWRVDLGDPAAPVVSGAAETDYPGGLVEVDDTGRAWLLHPQQALTAVVADTLVPSPGTLSRLDTSWAAPGGVRAAAQSEDGRLAVATGLGGLWVLGPDGQGGFEVLGQQRLSGEVDSLIWAPAEPGEEAQGYVWLTTQRPGALQALRVPRVAGQGFAVLGRMEGMGTPVSLALDEARELLYVADVDQGLWIVSADVAAPRLQSRFRDLEEAWDVLPDGDRAWVAAGDRGVLWLDTLNPRAASALFWLNTPGTAFGLAPFGSHVLVADLEAGLQTGRTLSGQLMPGGGLRLGQVTDVATIGGYGYAAVVELGVFEFDPRDIRVPLPRRAVRLPGLVRRVEVAPTPDPTLEPEVPARLLAAAGEGGLIWLDVNAPQGPAAPTPRPTALPSPTPFAPAYVPWAGTGREEPPFLLTELGALSAEALGGREIVGVAMRGNRAVVGLTRVRGGERAGLAALALSDSGLRLAGRYERLDVAPRDLSFDGEHIAVAAWADGLRLLRVNDVGRIDPAGALTSALHAAHVVGPPAGLDTGGEAGGWGLLHVGGTRLDPGPRAGLQTLDAGDPAAIELLAETRLPDVTAMARGPETLYVLDYTEGLRAFDVADPLTLTGGAALPLPGAAGLAADAQGRLVVAARSDGGTIDGGLIVLDAADPLAPVEVGRWARGPGEPGSRARHVALGEIEAPLDEPEAGVRTVAWLASERDLQVIDVSDPSAPVMLAARRLAGGGVVGLAAEGDRALLLHRVRGAILFTLE